MLVGGKLIEDLFNKQMMKSQRVASGTLWNGAAAASGNGIDTEFYDEMMIQHNAGLFNGDGQVIAALYEDDAATGATAVAVTSATVTITSANDNGTLTANVKLSEGRKRYQWLRTVKSGTGTVDLGVDVILGKGKEHPETQSPVPSYDV